MTPSLPELVTMLGLAKLQEREIRTRIAYIEKTIHCKAIDELKLVAAPLMYVTSRFQCAGKMVELDVSSSGEPAVRLIDMASIPLVPFVKEQPNG